MMTGRRRRRTVPRARRRIKMTVIGGGIAEDGTGRLGGGRVGKWIVGQAVLLRVRIVRRRRRMLLSTVIFAVPPRILGRGVATIPPPVLLLSDDGNISGLLLVGIVPRESLERDLVGAHDLLPPPRL